MNAKTVTVQTDGERVTGTSHLDLERSGVAGSDQTRDLAAVLPAGIAVPNVTAASDALDDLSPRLASIHHGHTEHIGIDGLNATRRRLVKAVRLGMQPIVPSTNHLPQRHSAAIDRTMSRILWKTSLVLFLPRKVQRLSTREVGEPINPAQVPSTRISLRTTTLCLMCSPTMTGTLFINDLLAARSQAS
jgi:hypothetical protein